MRGLACIGDFPSAVILRRACWPKVQHHSRGDADTHVRALRRNAHARGTATLVSYACRHCGAWHVGHDVNAGFVS
jgi:hypothetical protein